MLRYIRYSNVWGDGMPIYYTTPPALAAQQAGTSVVTVVVASITSGVILAANAARVGASIFNDSNKTLFLLFGAGTASATNNSVSVPQGGYVEVPSNYTGVVTGMWNVANGNARVTEFTP